MYSIFTIERRVANQPTKTDMVALRRSYKIIINRIGTTRKVLDIQRLPLWLSRPSDQILWVAPHCEKYYISMYDDKQLFIDFIIGAQVQQVNVTSNSVWSCKCSFQDRTSNLLARKKILPTPPSSPRDASIAKSSGSI